MAHPLLAQTAHRPWPLPAGPWVMTQTWYNLLFAHWPIATDVLRRAVPPQLELDLFEGQGYVGVVPFGMSRVYPRFTFPVPGLSYFLELNVRTYVRVGDKPGVYFFSLDAANSIAVSIARATYQLPYYNALMGMREETEGWIAYHSLRTHAGADPVEFIGRYRPTGEVYHAQRGTLEHWLTERYCLYTVVADGTVPNGTLYRGEIQHAPWPLQPAEAELTVNTMTLPPSLVLPDPLHPPLLHFARSIETLEWPILPVAGS